MDRFWLLTSTFYGNWLPGDPRGFVSSVRDHRPGDPDYLSRFEHDLPGTDYDRDMPGLFRAAEEAMKGDPVRVVKSQACVLLAQFKETAAYRGWGLLAASIMLNHVHLVVGVPGDPDPSDLLRDFKAYGSRALNKRWGKPRSGTWWTASGSKRILRGDSAVPDAVRYVTKKQWSPLAVWFGEPGASAPGDRRATTTDVQRTFSAGG